MNCQRTVVIRVGSGEFIPQKIATQIGVLNRARAWRRRPGGNPALLHVGSLRSDSVAVRVGVLEDMGQHLARPSVSRTSRASCRLAPVPPDPTHGASAPIPQAGGPNSRAS